MQQSETAQLLAAQTQQNELLTKILHALDRPELGLLDTPPGTQRIYCNRDRCPNALWYRLDASREPVGLSAKAIRGYLRQLHFEQVERRGKQKWKMYTLLDCGDRSFELESGYDATFSKGVISAIASLTPQQLQQPISIGVAPGDDESVLLSRVWLGDGSPIFVKWDSDTDWRALSKRAIANIEANK